MTKYHDATARNIAYIIFTGFLGALTGLFLLKVDGNMKDALMLLLGVLGAKVGSIVDYYFGNSAQHKSSYSPTPMPIVPINVASEPQQAEELKIK